jgi:hypothetical protein
MRLRLALTALGIDVPLARTSQIAICGFFVKQLADPKVSAKRHDITAAHSLKVLEPICRSRPLLLRLSP